MFGVVIEGHHPQRPAGFSVETACWCPGMSLETKDVSSSSPYPISMELGEGGDTGTFCGEDLKSGIGDPPPPPQ